jgi:chromosomal replication initiator protein
MSAAVSAELEQIWSHVQAELATAVDEPTYRTWLEPLRIRDLSSGSVTVEASPEACRWIKERFGRLLGVYVAAVLGRRVTVDVVSAGDEDDLARHPGRPRRAGTARGPGKAGQGTAHGYAAAEPSPEAGGNHRFTFDQFVIGDSNRLAHAAALAVAEMPGQAYNPLFICGPPGVGKTHLLHSIARLLIDHSPGLTVRTSTGESFTNEFQAALADHTMGGFKARFRHADVLLLDDIQFFERKTRTEEEFFHTFNDLHEAGAQIVLTSDRPPRDLQALEDRLRERFEAGLVADVGPPDFATRLAILRKRARHDGIESVDNAVLAAIAGRVTLNVRALEGALIRVVAHTSLTSRPLTTQLADEVLGSLYPPPRPATRSLDEIQAAACQHFGLSEQELISRARTGRVTWPRQLAMYLARELTDESLPAIGRHFGGRDHTTVLHACRRAEQRLATDVSSQHAVDAVRQSLQHDTPDRPT